MMIHFTAIVSAASMGVVSIAHADEPQEFYYSTRVVVDVSALADEAEPQLAEETYKTLATKLPTLLKDVHRIQVTEDGGATVKVSLRWIDYDTSLWGVDIDVTTPEMRAPKRIALTCKDCAFAADIYALLEREIPSVLSLLEQPVTEKPGQTPSPSPDVGNKKQRPLGPAGYAGIGLGVAGLATAIAGGVLVARGEETSRVDGQGASLETIDYRTDGYIALGVGGGALLVGAVLIAVDQTVLKRRRSRMAVVPSFSPNGGTISIAGRF